MGIFGNLFKSTSNADLKEKISNGAVLLDVRTKEEYRSGHAQGSVNVPLDTLSSKMKSLKKDTPIVAVCASGMRSSSATNLLKRNGFEVYNGGSWYNFS